MTSQITNDYFRCVVIGVELQSLANHTMMKTLIMLLCDVRSDFISNQINAKFSSEAATQPC